MSKAEVGRRKAEVRALCAALVPSLRAPHSALRTGISLLEVLISIGIMAVGLISVMSLLPVGGIQAQKADIEQRKAELGQSAYRDFKTRGMARLPSTSQLNETTNPTTCCPWLLFNGNPYFVTNPSPPPQWAVDSSLSAPYLPVAIDPLMVAAANGNNAIQYFPANHGSGPAIPRLRLSSCYVAGDATKTLVLADAIFRATDDVVIDQGKDAQLPPLASYTMNSTGTAAVKTDSSGLYSWLAMLTPYYPDQGTAVPVAGTPCTLSVVVFYRRSLPNSSAFNISDVREGTAQAEPSAGPPGNDSVGLGGGDVKLTAPSPAAPYTQSNPNPLSYARPGGWLMLACQRTVAGNPYTVCNWYRVVAGDAIDEASQTLSANVTLAGPDWVFAKGNTPQTYACLFDDVVAVYQRTIQLEGLSKWNQ